MTDPQWLTIATALGWTLVHSLWQIALIALLLKALLSISSNQSAHLRYGWSLVAMFAVLIGAGVTFGYYYEPIVPVIIENLPDLENNTWTDKMMPLESAEGTASWETWMIAVEQYLPYLVMAWLFGICCYTILMVQGFFQLKNLQRLHSNPVPKQWEHRLSELQAQLGIQRNVQFLTCKLLDEPITFGHFKPIILVPVGLLTGLSTAQVEVLLLHELAHIRRYDYLVNWLQSSLETLFFYHPAFWWISRQVRAEREHCCDDLVLGLHPAPMLYAQTLTQLQINHYSIKTNLAMAATKNQGAFTTRIHRLFGQYNSPNRQKKGGILMILLAIAMVTVAFYEPISLEERQDLTPANTVVVDTFPPNIQISPIIPESGNLDLFYRSEEAPMIYIDGKLASLEELRQIDVKAYDYCAFTEQEVAFYTKGSLASKQGRLFNDEQGVPSLTSDQLSPVELEKRIQAGEYAIIIGELAGNLSDDERTELKQIFETAFSDDTEDDFEYHVNAVLNENGDWEYDTTYSIQVEEDASGLDLSIKRANASPKGENMEQMIERLEKLNNEEQGLYIDRIRLSKNETGTVDTFINVRTRTAKLADKTKSRKILSLEDDEKRVDIKVKSDKKEQPLIVIDGRVVGKKPKAHLKTIDPDDISEINVLKGEAALEKYGEKGSDGVIEITTKASNKRKVHLEVIVFPEQEKIRFELGMNFNSSGNWAVYDPNGKKMEIKFEDTKGVENDRDLTIIDWLVKDLQAGTYTTTLEANGKKLKRKFVIGKNVRVAASPNHPYLSATVFEAAQTVRFELGFPANATADLAVHSSAGKRIKITATDVKDQGKNESGRMVWDWSTKDLRAGAYTAVLKTEGAKIKVKFRIEASETNTVATTDNISSSEVDSDAPTITNFGTLQVYPNPAEDQVRILFQVFKSARTELTIFDSQGNTVEAYAGKAFSKQQFQGNATLYWDAGNYPAGVYTAVLQVGNQQISKQIVVQ